MLLQYKKIFLKLLLVLALPVCSLAQGGPPTEPDGPPLPLQLTSFSARLSNNIITCDWQTANEVNVSHFNVQQSVNGVDFSTIGTIAITANHKYEYADTKASSLQANIIYYRLAIVDLDGKTAYSKTVSVNFGNKLSVGLQLYPNPVKDVLYVRLNGYKSGDAILQVTDMNGKTWQQQQVKLENGNAVFLSFNASVLAKGTYILSVQGSAEAQKKFVKQ